MSEEQAEAQGKESFALYGFELKIPETWRVEFNPRGTRDRGDVVFLSPNSNRIYVSWGPLAEADKRFKTVEGQRDWGIKRLKDSRNVRSISVTETRETRICGHKALITHVSASIGGGFTDRKRPDRHMNSVYFHCPDKSRYYVIYSLLNSPDEYSDFPKIFDSIAQSLICHGPVAASS